MGKIIIYISFVQLEKMCDIYAFQILQTMKEAAGNEREKLV